MHLSHQQIEYYLPLYHVLHRWKNRCTKHLDLPLFPGYVFVNFSLDERVQLLNTPGVVLIVGVGRVPTPLEDDEIEMLRRELHVRHAEPHPYLLLGQRVRIRSGALAGMEGVVTRKKNALRVVLSLDLIMKSVAVEVDEEELEIIAPHEIRKDTGTRGLQ